MPGSFAFTAPSTAPSAGSAPHSVTFTPGDSINYQTATTSVSVTVNPAQTNFALWASEAAQGLTNGINNTPMDDPDHDGISNLMEYALNTSPTLANPCPVVHDFVATGANTYLRLNVLKNPLAGDLDYIFEVASEIAPGSWTEVPTIYTGNNVSGTDTVATTSSAKRFIRLKVKFKP